MKSEEWKSKNPALVCRIFGVDEWTWTNDPLHVKPAWRRETLVFTRFFAVCLLYFCILLTFCWLESCSLFGSCHYIFTITYSWFQKEALLEPLFISFNVFLTSFNKRQRPGTTRNILQYQPNNIQQKTNLKYWKNIFKKLRKNFRCRHIDWIWCLL